MKDLLALTLPDGTVIQGPGNVPTGGTGTLEKILQTGVTLFLIFGVILSLIFLVWGGIDWILSGGDKEAIEKARLKLIYAIIGLVVMFISFSMIQILSSALGIELLHI